MGLGLDLLLDNDVLTFKQKLYVRSLVSFKIDTDIRGEVIIHYTPKVCQTPMTYFPDMKNPNFETNAYKHIMYSLIDASYWNKDRAVREAKTQFIKDNYRLYKYEQPLIWKAQDIYSLLERVYA